MKMAKASEADMQMAMELTAALDALGNRLAPSMPLNLDGLSDTDVGRFNRDNDKQCGRALRHLLDIADRGSLSRVVYGMAVLLDPKNKVVDPNADSIEHHPEVIAALAAFNAAPV